MWLQGYNATVSINTGVDYNTTDYLLKLLLSLIVYGIILDSETLVRG